MQYSKFMANLHRYDESEMKEISGVVRFEAIEKNVKLSVKVCFPVRKVSTVQVCLIQKSANKLICKTLFEGKAGQRNFTLQRIISEEKMKLWGVNVNEIKGVYIMWQKLTYAAIWDLKNADLSNLEVINDVEQSVKSNQLEQTDTNNEDKSGHGELIAQSISNDMTKQTLNEIPTKVSCGTQKETIKEISCEPLKETIKEISYEMTKEMSQNKNSGKKIDLMKLREYPKEIRVLANNSFLLHGFYNYHYIYIREENNRFLVGVPGIFYPQEEKIASIFGFGKFVPVENAKKEKGKFGYWCKSVEADKKCQCTSE